MRKGPARPNNQKRRKPSSRGRSVRKPLARRIVPTLNRLLSIELTLSTILAPALYFVILASSALSLSRFGSTLTNIFVFSVASVSLLVIINRLLPSNRLKANDLRAITDGLKVLAAQRDEWMNSRQKDEMLLRNIALEIERNNHLQYQHIQLLQEATTSLKEGNQALERTSNREHTIIQHILEWATKAQGTAQRYSPLQLGHGAESKTSHLPYTTNEVDSETTGLPDVEIDNISVHMRPRKRHSVSLNIKRQRRAIPKVVFTPTPEED